MAGREVMYRTDAVAFWGEVRRLTGVGVAITVLMSFVNPLIVLAVNDDNPSGDLYLLLIVLTGIATAAVMVTLARRHPQAGEYAKSHRSSPVLAGVGIAAAVGGFQDGLLARLFGDYSAQTFVSLGIGIAGLALVGLLKRAAERSA